MAAVDDQPAVSLARLAEIGVGDGEGLVPRVAEAEGLSLLQEEALMDMIYQHFVIEVSCCDAEPTAILYLPCSCAIMDDVIFPCLTLPFAWPCTEQL
jgi:hypothetical protein